VLCAKQNKNKKVQPGSRKRTNPDPQHRDIQYLGLEAFGVPRMATELEVPRMVTELEVPRMATELEVPGMATELKVPGTPHDNGVTALPGNLGIENSNSL
jgi:hypothetical protein